METNSAFLFSSCNYLFHEVYGIFSFYGWRNIYNHSWKAQHPFTTFPECSWTPQNLRQTIFHQLQLIKFNTFHSFLYILSISLPINFPCIYAIQTATPSCAINLQLKSKFPEVLTNFAEIKVQEIYAIRLDFRCFLV